MSNNKVQITKENIFDFCKVIFEFVPDLLTTFPEYKENLNQGIIDILHIVNEYKHKLNELKHNDSTYVNVDEENNVEEINIDENSGNEDVKALHKETKETLISNEEIISLYKHCLAVYPERFFDIIYQNEEIFTKSEMNTEFLPGIEFSELWSQNITDNTKQVIWKYLQVILLTVISSVKDKSRFGDTAKLFEAIDENELKQKLEETIEQMQNMFSFDADGNMEGMNDVSNINLDGVPNAEDIHSHLDSMMGGKLGTLAKEIAEETAKDLDINLEETEDVGQVFQKLFKNPGKLMGIVKNVGDKLEDKLKSGDLKESELIKEATEMMSKMQNMPGMGNIQSMLGKMGMPMGKNAKVSTAAFQSHMRQNLKHAQMRERMLRKLEKDKEAEQQSGQNKAIEPFVAPYTDEELIQEFKFSKGDAPERSKRIPTKSKKGGKNKKNKKKRKN
jgi:hypothetical protein